MAQTNDLSKNNVPATETVKLKLGSNGSLLFVGPTDMLIVEGENNNGTVRSLNLPKAWQGCQISPSNVRDAVATSLLDRSPGLQGSPPKTIDGWHAKIQELQKKHPRATLHLAIEVTPGAITNLCKKREMEKITLDVGKGWRATTLSDPMGNQAVMAGVTESLSAWITSRPRQATIKDGVGKELCKVNENAVYALNTTQTKLDEVAVAFMETFPAPSFFEAPAGSIPNLCKNGRAK